MCQIRKTRIKLQANIVPRANTRKAARFAIDNWCNKTTDMANSNRKAKIDSTNVKLAKFGIYIINLLANNVYKTCHKWAIDDFIKYNNNNFITLLIMNIKAESTTYIEKSLTICCYQVDKLDCLDIKNIDHVKKNIILLYQKIIRHGG